MTIRWRKSGLMITCALLVWFAPVAMACSCMESGPPCEGFWRADAVFVGLVDEISDTIVRENDEDRWTARLVRFSVESAFRGLEGSRVEIRTGMGGGDCGYGFKKGIRYLVYAHRSKDGRLHAGICSRTRPLAEAAEDLEYIRNLPPAGVGATIRGQIILNSMALADDSRFVTKPMEGVRVIVTGSGKDREVMTDGQGRFALVGLAPGKYKVRADLPQHLEGYTEAEVEIGDRACAALDFRVNVNGRISGRVLSSGDKPMPGVKVDIIPMSEATASSPVGKWRFTRENGAFQIDWLPPGIYLLGVNLIGSPSRKCPLARTFFPGVDDHARAQQIVIGENQELLHYDLQLKLSGPERVIEGVVLWPDGKPARAGVALWNAVPPYLIGLNAGTDENGHFTLKAPEGCSYRINAFTAGGRASATSDEIIPPQHSEPITVTVTAAKLAALKLVLTSPGYIHRDDESKPDEPPPTKRSPR